jgi:hypothetical protein
MINLILKDINIKVTKLFINNINIKGLLLTIIKKYFLIYKGLS